MLLSKAQQEYIKSERAKMDKLELNIRRIPEKDRYANEDNSRELLQIYNRRRFFNYMIDLHNVEKNAQKKAQKELEDQVEEALKD